MLVGWSRNQWWLRRDKRPWGGIFWEMFPESTEKLWSGSGQGCTSCWQLDLVMCKCHPGGTDFESMRRHGAQLGLVTMRVQGRPLVKVQPQWQLKARTEGVMQRSWGLALWREPVRGYWWKYNPVAAEESSISESMGMTTKNSSSRGVEPARSQKKRFVCCRGQSWRSYHGSLQESRRSWINHR